MQRQASDNFHNISPLQQWLCECVPPPQYLHNATELLTAKELTDLVKIFNDSVKHSIHSQMFLALVNIIKTQDMRVINKLHDSNLSFNLRNKTNWKLTACNANYLKYNTLSCVRSTVLLVARYIVYTAMFPVSLRPNWSTVCAHHENSTC